MGLPKIAVMGIASLTTTAWVSLRSTPSYGVAPRRFVGCGGPRRLEQSDTHQSVAQPPGFMGLPKIAVMGIAALNATAMGIASLNATAWVSLRSTPSYGITPSYGPGVIL